VGDRSHHGHALTKLHPLFVFSTHVPASQQSFTSVLLHAVVHFPPSHLTPLFPQVTSSHSIDASPARARTPPLQLVPLLHTTFATFGETTSTPAPPVHELVPTHATSQIFAAAHDTMRLHDPAPLPASSPHAIEQLPALHVTPPPP
jgi:hypothetical protein